MRRLIHFANNTVSLEADEPWGETLISWVFSHFPASHDSSPHTTLRLACDGSDRMVLFENGVILHAAGSQAALAEVLLGRLGYLLAERSHGGTLYHAAAVSQDGTAVVLPALSGSGKTTLTAWLLAHGWSYLTDELVFIPEGQDELIAYPRPLNVKRDALPVVESLRMEPSNLGGWTGPSSTLFPPELFGVACDRMSLPVSLLIFPAYRTGADYSLTALTPAHTAQALMATLLNTPNLPTFGLPEAARLARHIPGFRMEYGGFDQLLSNRFLEHLQRSG